MMRKTLTVAVLLLLPTVSFAQISYTPASIADFVLYSESGLAIATTGTVEEVLKTVTIPGGRLGSGFSGFEVHATITAAANTNQKTPRLRIGGLAGTVVMAHTNDATSGNRFQFHGTFTVNGAGSLDGQGLSSRVTGSSNLFGTAALTGIDFAAPLLVTATGTTPTAAGDLTLTSMRVVLLRRVP